MKRDSKLIASLLHYCVNGATDWRLGLTVEDLHESLAPDEQLQWGKDTLEGHVRLLADARLIEMRMTAGELAIERITWAGYEHLEAYEKSRLIRDNPFLRDSD